MKRVTAIRHVAFEDLGSFAGVLTDNGFEIRHSTHRPLKHDKAAAKGAATTLLPLAVILFARPKLRPICKTGGTLEHAKQIAAHQSPRTTKLYDRTE